MTLKREGKMNQKVSSNGIIITKQTEQCYLHAYLCPAGVWTIGWGHTKGVKKGDTITMAQAEKYLLADLAEAENIVNKELLNLSQNQFDAIVDFVFNVGSSKFLASTLLKTLKTNPKSDEVATQLRRWVYADGSHNGKDDDKDGVVDESGEKQALGGLVARREAEIELYFRK